MVKEINIKKIKPIYDNCQYYFFKWYLFTKKVKVGDLIYNVNDKKYGIMMSTFGGNKRIFYEEELNYLNMYIKLKL